jgi:DNA-binding transcriptional LysR family regulator
LDPNWDDLRVFLAVARGESLSGAARLLRLDPATIGRRVSRLESAMGAALFIRSPQGYVLNGAGQKVLDQALQAEQAMLATRDVLIGQSDEVTGQVRIGAPDGAANYLLPQVCSKIAQNHPKLDIQIVALPRVFNLSKREADMALAVSAPTPGRLHVEKVTDYKLSLAASKTYLESHPAIERIEDLKSHPLVGYIPDMIFDSELDYLSDLGVERVALASNSVSVQFNWVRQGGGLGIVHDFAMPSAPDVQKVLTDQISLTRGFYLIQHEADRNDARLSLFARELSDGVRSEVARLEAIS